MFDLQVIQTEMKSTEENCSAFRENLKALQDIDLETVMSNQWNLTESDALAIISAKLGTQQVFHLREAMMTVPRNIVRVKKGVSMRTTFILEILRSQNNSIFMNYSLDDVGKLTKFIEYYCPLFLANRQEVIGHKFLSPPLADCMKCSKRLTMHNDPSQAKLFTLKGPINCSKVTLECRNCCIKFGIASYTSGSGTYLYPEDLDQSYIEISTHSYMDVDLYKWIPSLR